MESEQHFLYWVELNTCEQNWHPLQPNGSHKPEKQAAWGSNLLPGPVKPVALVQGVPYKWDLPNGKSPDRQGQGASSAHQGTYPDAGIPDPAFLLPKMISQSRSFGPVWAQRERGPQGQGGLGNGCGGGGLSLPFHASLGVPAAEMASLIWPGHGSTAGIPSDPASGGILQLSTLPKAAGVERNPIVSDQAQRLHRAASCPWVDPRGAPKICCWNSAFVHQSEEKSRDRVWGEGEKK